MASAPSASETTPSQSANVESKSKLKSNLYSQFHAYPFSTDAEYQAGLSSILGHPGTPTSPAELDANPGLVLNAKLFYFNTHIVRKQQSGGNGGYQGQGEGEGEGEDLDLDAKGYVDWLHAQTKTRQAQSSNNNGSANANANANANATVGNEQSESNPIPQSVETEPVTEAKGGEPRYPSSFAAIIDLITNNKPVPGIEQIPDTVLEPGSSRVDNTPRRRKPWEKDQSSHDVNQGLTLNQNDSDGQKEEKAGQAAGAETDSDGLLRLLQPGAIPPSGLLANKD